MTTERAQLRNEKELGDCGVETWADELSYHGAGAFSDRMDITSLSSVWWLAIKWQRRREGIIYWLLLLVREMSALELVSLNGRQLISVSGTIMCNTAR